MRPHRRQTTRLPHAWDSPGKNTGVGCHFLLQCMKVKSASEVAQSCPSLRDPMDCGLPGFSTHGIFQARVLEWGAIAFSKPKSGTLHQILSRFSLLFVLLCFVLWCHPILSLIFRKKLITGFSFLFPHLFKKFPYKEGKLVRVMRSMQYCIYTTLGRHLPRCWLIHKGGYEQDQKLT